MEEDINTYAKATKNMDIITPESLRDLKDKMQKAHMPVMVLVEKWQGDNIVNISCYKIEPDEFKFGFK